MNTNDDSEVDRMIAERFSPLRADSNWHPDMQRGLSLLRDRRATANGRKRGWALAVAGLVAASVPIMAFPVTRAIAHRCVSACIQETALVRQLLLGSTRNSAPSSTYVSPSDRKLAPDFTLADAAGRSVKLSESRGKVVLLNFWATECAPCGRQIPWFVEFQRANEARGFKALGVAMDESGWAAVKPFVERMGVNYPMMIGNDEVASLFGGLHTIPLTLVIDRQGRIAAVHAGFCRKDEYEGDIRALLNEQ
jgi:peroxiredoxin